jgi:hypothetical protein
LKWISPAPWELRPDENIEHVVDANKRVVATVMPGREKGNADLLKAACRRSLMRLR